MQWWVLTFAPAAAIVIATIVYVWQRKLENGFQILAERRLAYSSFLVASVKLRQAIRTQGHSAFESNAVLFLSEYYSVWLVAPENLLSKLVDYEDALLELKGYLKKVEVDEESEEYNRLRELEGKAFFDLFFAMKNDVRGQVSSGKMRLHRDFF